jgi:hypothetical protein
VEIAPMKIVKTNPETVCAECEIFKYKGRYWNKELYSS